MTIPLVKLCGLRDTDDARAAVRAHADLIGIVLVPGARRFVPTPTAAAMAVAAREAARELGRFAPEIVGVFGGDVTPVAAVRIANAIGLDRVQLVGEEQSSFELARLIGAQRVIRAIAAAADADVDALELRCSEWERTAARVLIDAGEVNGVAGGTGTRVHDRLAARLVRGAERGLAGGLNPENVARAINLFEPSMVDVSSGIEIDGAKDPALMRAFVAAVRAAQLDDADRDPGSPPAATPAEETSPTGTTET